MQRPTVLTKGLLTTFLVLGLYSPCVCETAEPGATKSQEIEGLIEQLHSPDPHILREAILGKIVEIVRNNPDLLPVVQENLSGDSWLVRRDMVRVLSHLDLPDPIPLLLRAAHDPNWAVRYEAVLGLAGVDTKDVRKALRQLTRDDIWKVRLASLKSLAASADEKNQHFFSSFLNDSDVDVRYCAATWLIQHIPQLSAETSNAVIESFVEKFAFDDWQLNALDLAALSKMSDSALARVITRWSQTPADVKLQSLSNMSRKADPVFVAFFSVAARDPDESFRRSIIQRASSVRNREFGRLLAGMARKDPSAEVRKEALGTLYKFKDPAVTDAVLSAVRDENDQRTRNILQQAVRNINDPQAAPRMAAMLHTQTDTSIRVAILYSLGQIKSEKSIPAIIKALNGQDDNVRRAASQALGAMKALSAAGELLKNIKQESRPGVRAASIRALGMMSYKDATPAIAEALKDTNAEVRRSAARALASLRDPRAVPALVQALKDADENVRTHVIRALGRMGDASVVMRLMRIVSEDDSENTRLEAARALGRLRAEAAVAVLIESLKSDDSSRVRMAAARALGSIGDHKAIPQLLTSISQGGNQDLVGAYKEALSQLGDRKLAPKLMELLNSDSDATKMAAVELLGRFQVSGASKRIGEILTDENASMRLRRAAAAALGQIKDPAALPSLIQTVNVTDVGLRISVVKAIRNLGGPEASVVLLKVLREDSNERVRSDAAYGLSSAQIPGVREALIKVARSDHMQRVRNAAIYSLGQMNAKEAVPLLNDLVSKDPSESIRTSAANSLGRLGDSSSLPVLLEAARTDVVSVRVAAIQALGQLHAKSAVAFLIESLKGNNSFQARRAAAQALGEIGDREAVPYLRYVIKQGSNPELIRACKDALSRFGDDALTPELKEN